MRRLPLILVCTLLACGRGAVPPDDTRLPDNPCALVTVDDVESVTGSTVVRSELVPEDRLLAPPGEEPPDLCEYVTEGRHASITVSVDPGGASEFTRTRSRDPLNTENVAGVGDEAFVHGLAAFYVRVGDGYLVLATQHGAGRSGARDLQTLALAALD